MCWIEPGTMGVAGADVSCVVEHMCGVPRMSVISRVCDPFVPSRELKGAGVRVEPIIAE